MCLPAIVSTLLSSSVISIKIFYPEFIVISMQQIPVVLFSFIAFSSYLWGPFLGLFIAFFRTLKRPSNLKKDVDIGFTSSIKIGKSIKKAPKRPFAVLLMCRVVSLSYLPVTCWKLDWNIPIPIICHLHITMQVNVD